MGACPECVDGFHLVRADTVILEAASTRRPLARRTDLGVCDGQRLVVAQNAKPVTPKLGREVVARA